ncbi:MAG: M23 family metallopeptidase [Byssovorax sp.]
MQTLRIAERRRSALITSVIAEDRMGENRLPFSNLTPTSGWNAAGNFDSNTGAHAGVQPFAWDYGFSGSTSNNATTAGKIYAARAGIVVRVINDVPDWDRPPGKMQPASYVAATQATPWAAGGYGGSARGGNQVAVRHADGTVFFYCHMKTSSIGVTVGQYVLQGALLGVVGFTGNTGGAVHTHFERVGWAEPLPYASSVTPPNVPFNLDNYQGSSLLSHFEGPIQTSLNVYVAHAEPWRPTGGDPPGAEPLLLTQDGWRCCYKCASLYFSYPGIGGTTCAAGGTHAYVYWSNYSVSPDAAAPGQPNWEWCQKCNQMFYSINGATRCPVQGPAGNYNHDGSLSSNYRLQSGGSAPGEHGWKWCSKCQTLWSSTAVANGWATSKCPSDNGAHGSSATDYALEVNQEDNQPGWRRCIRCDGIFVGAGSLLGQRNGTITGDNGVCPVGSGTHQARIGYTNNGLQWGDGTTVPLQGTWRFTLNHSVSPNNAEAGNQNRSWVNNWSWCSKCQVLFSGAASAGACPVGGPGATHNKGNATNYVLLSGAPPSGAAAVAAATCSKCLGLVFVQDGSSGPRTCSGGGTHTLTGSLTVFKDIIST